MFHDLSDNMNDDYDALGCNVSELKFGRKSHLSSRKNADNDKELEYPDQDQLMTITIPLSNIKQLQQESDTKQVSLNTRINQIIKNHLDWHKDASDAQMYYLPRPLIAKVFTQLSKEQLLAMTESLVSYFHDTCLLLRGEFNFSSFLDVLKIWLRVTRTPNRFEDDEYEYKIIIKHDLGYKYSYLMKEAYRYIIQGRFKKSFHCTLTENIILIKSAK
jgi:hypothetical protein